MRILVTESDAGQSAPIIRELTQAGHEVVTCHRAGEAAFPCRGLAEPGTCPLDQHDPVDVTVAVRAHPHPRPRPRELAVTCTTRASVPLVVTGNLALDPFRAFGVETHEGDLNEAIDRALRRRDQRFAAEAAAAARAAFPASHEATLTATATIRGRRAFVTLN
jgi:hypothetical protein